MTDLAVSALLDDVGITAIGYSEREVREYLDIGHGLPLFTVGYEFLIGGQRVMVDQVISTLDNPRRVVLKVVPVT